MIGEILHVGLTVTDIERSIEFYRDVMGLTFIGQLFMEGKETEKLFGHPGCKAKVAYLKGNDDVMSPPVELIQFVSDEPTRRPADLFTTSISEICFVTSDIDKEYQRMKELGVEFLSEPQEFDFTADGFGKSKAVYFKDPDGIIQELMQAM